MGNTKSEFFESDVSLNDPWWNKTGRQKVSSAYSQGTGNDIEPSIESLRRRRIQVIGAKKKEMDALRDQLEESLRENDGLRGSLVNAESQIETFQKEREEYAQHVASLKEVIALSKRLLVLRDDEVKDLSRKVEDIKASLARRENTSLSADLRTEYERQLSNVRQLRIMYEERQRLDRVERDTLRNRLEEAGAQNDQHKQHIQELNVRLEELETDNRQWRDSVGQLQSQLALSEAGCRDLQAELATINKLFSGILVGNTDEIDLDRLVHILEQNHDLLTDIVVNEDCHEASSALPKVLLDLVNRVNGTDETPSTTSSESATEQNQQQSKISINAPQEIVQNLPKVWRVLAELLSHRNVPVSALDDESGDSSQDDANPCYKSVQTPTGTRLVLSVSKTFIRLKDLIVEKKSLEKETSRLKQLNTHLESRLQDQEKRLELVSVELSKTWHVVEKMQKQHAQLHTQEKILRYELAQKRKLLTELKEELEYCREKWLQARTKNSHTEEQWRQLRNEFVARKSESLGTVSVNVESGYSDDRESSSSSNSDNEGSHNEPIYKVVREEMDKIEETSRRGDGSFDEMLQAREERLTKLEEQASSLVAQTALTSQRGMEMCSRLDDLHRAHGPQRDVDKIYKNLEDDIIQTIRKTQSGEMSGEWTAVPSTQEDDGNAEKSA